MTRVYTQKARKDYPRFGIKKGDTYHRWAFFRQPERMGLTYPTRSQLTNDEGKQILYSAYDGFSVGEDFSASDLQILIDEVQSAADSFRERFDNMPEGLQQGDTGQMLEENANSCESAVSQLEDLMSTLEGEEDERDSEYRDDGEWNAEAIQEAVSGTEPDLQ